jgi:hypothetical protein
MSTGSVTLPLPTSPTPAPPASPTATDAHLERLMDGVSDERLARALGPRLDILFADCLGAILMTRMQQQLTSTAFLGTIDLAPLVQRHLDTIQSALESTWTTRIDRPSTRKAPSFANRPVAPKTKPSDDALANFGLA